MVHAVALGVLAISFAQKPLPLAQRVGQPEAVEAVVVDEKRVQEELRRLKTDEQLRREAEETRKNRLQQELELARKAKEQENQRLAELKQKREQDQREAEQQRKQLAELKAQQVQLEKKRQQEQARLAEAEKKRKSEEARVAKLEAEKQLRAKMEAEQKRLAGERTQRLARLVSQYEADIGNKVRRNWLRPAGSAETETFECKVFVKQLPGGDVISVQVTQSCGSPALDRSVEAAVRKASPLPAPPTPELFDKEINFIFRPR
jgi:colicin import membrane protein